MALHVLLGHPPRGAATSYPVYLDALLFGQAAGDRRSSGAVASDCRLRFGPDSGRSGLALWLSRGGLALWLSRGGLALWLSRSGLALWLGRGWLAGSRLDYAQRLAHGHVGPFLLGDRAEDATYLGPNLHVYFVRLELNQNIADRDRVAGLLEPAANSRLNDRLAKVGHYNWA
jgi:hypothetical protein